MFLHLDSSFNPSPGGQEVEFETFVFSGGEPHIKIKSDINSFHPVTVTHRINNFNDIGLLLVAVDALRRMNVNKISAYLPYFPGARQDRVMIEGEPLTVKIYADLINSCNFEHISIFDPHSEVTPALLNNCTVVSNHEFIKGVIKSEKIDFLISPDGGALKKIYKLAAELKNYPVVECSKTRDVSTGQLSGFQVYSEDLEGKSGLIVDDICDGGGTFLGLADSLKKKGIGNLHLAVSHGIFSKGLSDLKTKFDSIHTTDSIKNRDSDHLLKQHKLNYQNP